MANETQQLNTLLSSMRTASSFSQVPLSVLNDWVRTALTADKYDRELRRAARTGNTSVVTGGKDSLDILKRYMDEKKIPFLEGSFGGKQGLIFPSSHEREISEKISEIQLMERTGSERSASEMIAYSGDADFMEISGLSSENAEMLQLICNKKNIPYHTVERFDGTFSIQYASKDSPRMERARMDMIAAQSGKHGEILHRQLAWKNEHYLEMEKHLKEDLPQENIYYVDGSGREILTRNNEAICTDRDSRVVIRGPFRRTDLSGAKAHREMDEYVKKVRGALSAMDTPVRLTEDEYRLYSASPNRKEFLAGIQKKQGRPALTGDEIKTLASAEMRFEFMEKYIESMHPATNAETFTSIGITEMVCSFSAEELKIFRTESEKYQSVPESGSGILSGRERKGLDRLDREASVSPMRESMQAEELEESFLQHGGHDRGDRDMEALDRARDAAMQDEELNAMWEMPDISFDE